MLKNMYLSGDKPMSSNIIYRDLGVIDYIDALEYQQELFNELLAAKGKTTERKNYLLFCEHPHVFTLGKSGKAANLLLNEEALRQKGVSFFRTNRGGDITYHGPGQIVGYPILDLESFSLGVRAYIELLESAVIILLEKYGIQAARFPGASGTWLDTGTKKARKICAVGVRTSRYITMHGFAFNVNTDLDYFGYINPCGFVDKGVTSMENELGKKQDMAVVKKELRDIIIQMLHKG